MSQTDLKQKAVKGIFWSFCERFGSLLILFVANVVLARLLTPEEFGTVGILMAFVLISQILVDGGLGNALIQRKGLTSEDCSTVFYTNILVATLCYLSLFFGADAIADFYGDSALALMLRILGLVVVFDSIGAVQNNLLMKDINFRRITIIKISAALISSVVAIIFAILGYGIWSLIIQYLLNSIVKSLMLWIVAKWMPMLTFSVNSFSTLFGYGWKLLMASLLSECYNHLQVLIIGKLFPAREAGYYSQAKHLQDVPITTLLTIVNQVTFPVFSKLQDDFNQLVRGLSRSVKILTFINFPIMFWLAIIGESVFEILYGDKWLLAVPYFQWLCAGYGLLRVIHNTNLNALKAVGKSDTVLILEIVKKISGLTLIFGFIYLGYGAISIMWALTINSVIEFFLNGYFVGKYIGYGITLQLKDIIINLFIACVAGIITFISNQYIVIANPILLLLTQTVVFAIIYIGLMKMCKVEVFSYLVAELTSRLKKKP